MSTPELDRLIVEHINEIDGAATRIEGMERLIWQALADVLEDWCKANGWRGGFDIDDDLQIWPEHWEVDDQKQAWFGLGFGHKDEDLGLYFDLSRLVGAGGGQICLWFGYRGLRNPWKAAARERAEDLRSADFVLTPYGDFYTDCTPVTADMAFAFETGDFSAAQALIRSALDRARAAEPTFTEILRKLKAI